MSPKQLRDYGDGQTSCGVGSWTEEGSHGGVKNKRFDERSLHVQLSLRFASSLLSDIVLAPHGCLTSSIIRVMIQSTGVQSDLGRLMDGSREADLGLEIFPRPKLSPSRYQPGWLHLTSIR